LGTTGLAQQDVRLFLNSMFF